MREFHMRTTRFGGGSSDCQFPKGSLEGTPHPGCKFTGVRVLRGVDGEVTEENCASCVGGFGAESRVSPHNMFCTLEDRTYHTKTPFRVTEVSEEAAVLRPLRRGGRGGGGEVKGSFS
jgi:hypothetical protein